MKPDDNLIAYARVPRPVTSLLYLDHPSPRTALATVTATRGQAFVLDKSIFSPGASACGHPQPADRGLVWLGGDKRNLRRVSWHHGELLHTLEGAVPKRDEQVRCHLEADRRAAIEDAHTAMHLVLASLARGEGNGRGRGTLVLTDAARVQGARQFMLTGKRESFQPKIVADALAQANAAAARELTVRVEAATELREVDELPHTWADVLRPPAEAPHRVVRIGDASALVCDGTFRGTTSGLGRIILRGVRPSGASMQMLFAVARA